MSQSDNKLLATLPRSDYQHLQPLLRTLHLSAEMRLPHCGQTRVYFPGTGLCSIINKMADGGAIEVACIGSGGVVGLQALAGESPDDRNGFVQVADGTVQYMPSVFFEREIARNGTFRHVIDGFCRSFLEGMIQSVACNRLHTPQQRCCRWLLSVHDRVGRARFELKIRFLARHGRAGFRGRGDRRGAGRRGACQARWRVDDHSRRCRTAPARMPMLRSDEARIYTRALRRAAARSRAAGVRARPADATRGRKLHVVRFVKNVPHKSGHECILALDDEISSLVQRTHLLRKYRAHLMADRAQLFRDILKRSNGRI